jgi:hypothetical protein
MIAFTSLTFAVPLNLWVVMRLATFGKLAESDSCTTYVVDELNPKSAADQENVNKLSA